MIGPGLAGASFSAYATGFEAGLAGILTVSIETVDGVLVMAPTTAGVIEIDAGGSDSTYRFAGTFPAVIGEYVLIWEDADGVQASEELIVASIAVAVSGDIVPGPAEAWTDGEAVAECCSASVGTDTSLLDAVAITASQILFELSGRRYTGTLERTVRPCRTRPGCSHTWGSYDDHSALCGCGVLSRVLLPGFPVTSIISVTIDGDIVAPSTYRVDEHAYLTRVRDPSDPTTPLSWPACQALDVADTEEGTFAVRYLAGLAPPSAGVSAAGELACQLYLACGDAGAAGAGDCALPIGVTKITRQGVTMDLGEFTTWAYKDGRWHSGLALVDTFLNAYNPGGARRPPAVFSPDGPQFARQVGS